MHAARERAAAARMHAARERAAADGRTSSEASWCSAWCARAAARASARFHIATWPDSSPAITTSVFEGQKRKVKMSPGAERTYFGLIGSAKLQSRM